MSGSTRNANASLSIDPFDESRAVHLCGRLAHAGATFICGDPDRLLGGLYDIDVESLEAEFTQLPNNVTALKRDINGGKIECATVSGGLNIQDFLLLSCRMRFRELTALGRLV
jgi:hypothetical protein